MAKVLMDLTGQEIPENGLGWHRIRCPFPDHDDSQASAAVHNEYQMFVCHGCGRSGDAIKLLRNELGLSFKEAKQRAEYITGVRADRRKSAKKRRVSDILRGKP